jgi:hypothetical protein
VPAAVTIAQAIVESAWGQSGLAAKYHNLFGIKGTGPAGSVLLPAQEDASGKRITIDAPFRIYHHDAESVSDHVALLATGDRYTQVMADRTSPDAFANGLTGVYATDSGYGANLIALMKLYNLYQYDVPASPVHPAPPTRASSAASTSIATPAATRSVTLSLPSRYGPAAGKTTSTTAGTTDAPKKSASMPGASIPGVATPRASIPGGSIPRVAIPGVPAARPVGQARLERTYDPVFPNRVQTAFFATARTPIRRAEPLYKDIANQNGISWELLAACDWMQCQAQSHLSPVHGERLGTVNRDGTVYRTKSAALVQCAIDMVELAHAVYAIDLTAPQPMSVQALANVFAAFRWGSLLRKHHVSSLEFPYSVEGLTEGHVKMRWPAVEEPQAPDKPGTRFKLPFGAVPLVLSLNYKATV